MGFLREPANEGTRPFRHVMADRRWSPLPPGSPGAVGGWRAAGGTDGQCAASDLWRFGDLFPIRKMAQKAA